MLTISLHLWCTLGVCGNVQTFPHIPAQTIMKSVTTWLCAAAALCLLTLQNAHLATEVRIARDELVRARRLLEVNAGVAREADSHIKGGSLSVGGATKLGNVSVSTGRALLTTVADADSIQHTGASASDTLVLSSTNAAVEIKSAASKDIAVSPGNSQKATFSSGGDLTLSATSSRVTAKVFQTSGGATSGFSAGSDLGPGIYLTTGTTVDCTSSGNRGAIFVQYCQTGKDCLCYCGNCDGCGGYGAYCITS